MTLLPVIERELRAESRSAFTYWLRFFGAMALLAAGVLFFTHGGLGHMAGGQLFQVLHLTLFVAVWVVATLMTVDSISRERREGTLGLLFLTPLRPIEVVLAKGLAHGLRAAGVCLAAVPVLVVPFLMGGVGWRQAMAAVLIDFSALCWALAAGILASSFCRTMTRALVTGVLMEGAAFIVLAAVQATGLWAAVPKAAFGRSLLLPDVAFDSAMAAIIDPHEVVLGLSRAGNPATASRWLISLAVIAVASLAVCLLAAMLAAFNVRRTVRDKGPSIAMQKVEKEFCTPAFALGFFRRWMRRVLERNPIGWLERRTWQARLVTWSWLAVMISILSWAVGRGYSDRGDLDSSMTLLGWLLVANVALTAAGSLRRERESGVIELLLVSPLTAQQLIGGRLRGIGGQFLPAVLLFFGSWLWLLHAFANTLLSSGDGIECGLTWIGFFAITLLTIPVAGLYFSLRCRVFLVALFWTAGLGLALPWFVSNVFWGQLLPKVITCSVLQIGIAVLLGARLRRRLERREFSLPQ